jgi:poly(3-hydroxybutyrate) depolymerase
MPPMIVFQGTVDGTVRPVNARRIADQWLAYHADDAGRSLPASGRRKIGAPRVATSAAARPASSRSRRGHTVSRWYSAGQKVLELWLVDGLGHAWSGGSTKGSYSDPRGPRATTEMWRFFSAHRSSAALPAIRVG